jgi:hypothetical protein
LIIGIGQVTEHIKAQRRYENLVEALMTIELNKEGNLHLLIKIQR